MSFGSMSSLSSNPASFSASSSALASAVSSDSKLGEVESTTLPAFIDSISYLPFQDPVVTADGHTYERAMIREWFHGHSTSPLTGRPLRHKILLINWALKNAMAEYDAEQKKREVEHKKLIEDRQRFALLEQRLMKLQNQLAIEQKAIEERKKELLYQQQHNDDDRRYLQEQARRDAEGDRLRIEEKARLKNLEKHLLSLKERLQQQEEALAAREQTTKNAEKQLGEMQQQMAHLLSGFQQGCGRKQQQMEQKEREMEEKIRKQVETEITIRVRQELEAKHQAEQKAKDETHAAEIAKWKKHVASLLKNRSGVQPKAPSAPNSPERGSAHASSLASLSSTPKTAHAASRRHEGENNSLNLQSARPRCAAALFRGPCPPARRLVPPSIGMDANPS